MISQQPKNENPIPSNPNDSEPEKQTVELTSQFAERMKTYQQQKQNRLEERRKKEKEKEENELKKMTFIPKINPSDMDKRTVDDMRRWGEKAKEKVEKLRKDIQKKEENGFKKANSAKPRNDIHVINRFIELEGDKPVTMQVNTELVDDRLYMCHKIHKNDKQVEGYVSNCPRPVKTEMTLSSTKSKSEQKRTNALKKKPSVSYIVKEKTIQTERKQLKDTIHQTKIKEKSDEVNYISMNATQVNKSFVHKPKEICMSTIKNLKDKVRNEILADN